MEIYSKPKMNISDDGTYTFVCKRLTPASVQELIDILDGICKVEFSEIVEILSNAAGTQEAEEALCKNFNLTHSQSIFLLETDIADSRHLFNRKWVEEEIDKYKKLLPLLCGNEQED